MSERIPTFILIPLATLALWLVPGLVFASKPEVKGEQSAIMIQVGETFSKEILSTQYVQWQTAANTIDYDRSHDADIENDRLIEGFFPVPMTRLIRATPHLRLVVSTEIRPEAIESFLLGLEKESRVEPHDARFQMNENGQVSLLDAGRDGFALDIGPSRDVLRSVILQSLADLRQTRTVKLPTVVIRSQAASQNVDSLGIKTLIGEGTTDFSGSPKNRIFNIHRAVEQFHGVLIKPGEEFSFVKYLGEVDGEHGYLPELVIRNNKTQPEFGGGICQVSTTLFRAAIYGGLKITERRNHSYPVRYYRPIGFDATIYVPKPDFKFMNNTPTNILVQAFFTGNKLTFRLYGTDDGRKTTVIGPKVTERGENGSMKAEFTQLVVDSVGGTLIEETFKSNYDSPDNYPHPGDIISEKPDDWSKKQWDDYKKTRPVR